MKFHKHRFNQNHSYMQLRTKQLNSMLKTSTRIFIYNTNNSTDTDTRVQWYTGQVRSGHAHNRPQGPKGVPGRLRPRIILTFGTTRVVVHQPHAPAAFTPRGIPWYSFLGAESTPGHMVPSVATEKIPSVTSPGIDPETVRLVAQWLNHYATPGPTMIYRGCW
jgi:hypothetical protein